MSGFSETAMNKRLETLTATSQSIQTVSMWLLHHQKNHADEIVQLWLKEVKREVRPGRLINLLYLANDVIQNSRKQSPGFMALFYTVLEPAFRHVSTYADSNVVTAMKKILRVFRERSIYSPQKIEQIYSAVRSSLTGVRLVEFNMELGNPMNRQDSNSRLRLTPTTPPHVGTKRSFSMLNSPQPSSSTPTYSSPAEKKVCCTSDTFENKKVTFFILLSFVNFSRTEAVLDVKAMAQVSTELIDILRKLDDPPSADGDTRQLIASFPEAIANPVYLKGIKNDKQARALLERINEADPIVKNYCKRLFDEMNDRRNINRLLTEYYDFLKTGMRRVDEMSDAMREKVDKLVQEKAECNFKIIYLILHVYNFSYIEGYICWCEMGILEKIQEIEREIGRTQKNKATEYHLGLLKAKLAKYRQQLLEPTTKGGTSKGDGFDVMKSGDARIAMVGFPSVGKSTLLSSITTTQSETAAYEFTTLTCIPGVIEYEGANIQLLDLPGIIEGASQGKGRGRQVIAVARTADLILMILDAVKGEEQKAALEKELEYVGIRINKTRPHIYLKQKKIGGIKFTHTVPVTHCNEKIVMSILHEYKIFNADVVFRDDCTVDELIDVIQGNRVYIQCLYVYNKIDQISIQEVDRLARQKHSVVISCEMNLNLDYMIEKIWEYLALIRIFTKKPGHAPDLGDGDGIILRRGATVEHACHALHRSIVSQFRYAIVWGTSTRFSPQRVGLHHKLDHEDVIQIVKK
uniref:CID domain-containing protein n=1 Tax=Syphacia muris TaxID=451379 RepID=A0A0N5AQ93_9BILA